MFRPAALILPLTASLLAVSTLGVVGCDDSGRNNTMVLRPRGDSTTTPTENQTTPPSETEEPAEPTELDGPAFIYVDGERFDFPSARLRLESLESDEPGTQLVRATLFSKPGDDDKANSFYFEMDLHLLAEELNHATGTTPTKSGQSDVQSEPRITADDLANAEWYFPGGETEKVDSPSGIYLTGKFGERGFQLQPAEVSVMFTPQQQGRVEVSLLGDFNQFPAKAAAGSLPTATVRVRAVLATTAGHD